MATINYKCVDGVLYVRAMDVPIWLEETAVNCDFDYSFQTGKNLRAFANSWRKWILDIQTRRC